MNDCIGLMGMLFGHKFEPRRDIECGEGKWPFVQGTLESQMAAATNGGDEANIIHATKTQKETYVYDLCARCGKIIER